MTWAGLLGLWLILGVGMWVLLWITDYRDLRPDTRRELQVRARRGLR